MRIQQTDRILKESRFARHRHPEPRKTESRFARLRKALRRLLPQRMVRGA